MIEITQQSQLNKETTQNPRVFALFHASWCPFCRNFLSVFNKYAQKTASGVFLRVKIDEDDNPMWGEYSLVAVPSIILFENGQVASRLDCELGAGLTEQQLSRWLKSV
jgi:thioredoxin-like negative regulator of GroEL